MAPKPWFFVEIGQKSENMVAKQGMIPYFAEKCTVMVVFKCRVNCFYLVLLQLKIYTKTSREEL